MAIAELSIVPIGTKSTSLSPYVAACLKVLEDSGLTYELHGMGTIIEGDLKDLFDVMLKMHEVPFEAGALRVVTSIKIDDRRDKEASAKDKVKAVLTKRPST
ncbi:MAG: MTH1187 family thiamine-binding protein [Deltaproteobacteria bacterium]|nr:MTH1187 family thiamine-binding protein [Deltaproteobacteria bacterium]MBW2019148.1 MTH1187 family thiamine-binding protein [Deltaproteobacteria bacterium]MBW2073215.1 MTH1187 family thiamine-binding protein [Deltaproteobacteria bacterium]RLB83834.1 MAG: thiamine-binding protein [Deltaproteobacteria bacterium]